MTSERVPARGVVHGGGADSLPLEQLSLDSRAVAVRVAPRGPTPSWPLTPPICHASTYRMNSCDDFLALLSEGGAVYSRLGNETAASVEAAITALEGGAGSLVFSSGMAAITTVLMAFLKSGDHVVANCPMYSGTFAFLKTFCDKFGVELSFARSGSDVQEYRKLVKPNTKVLYGETPCNPAMEITDLEAFGQLGRSLEGVVTVIDGTFASPYLQQPIRHGVDISIHSCTKYMGGHSDLMGGCVTTRTVEQWRLVRKWSASLLGNVLSPPDCSLLLRSLRTLPVRMLRHSENALKVATFLENHPKVIRVAYPGLPSHPGHKVAARQMRAFGGMIMAEVKGGTKGGQLVSESVRLVTLAVSLGGVDSLVEHPHSMTHGPYLMSAQDTSHSGITEGMLRISIGLEDPDDLIKDFQQALDKIPD